MDASDRERDRLVSGGGLTMSPEGWLIDPAGKWLLLFHKDPMSLQRLPLFYIDKWDVSSVGTPNTFINRRKVGQQAAIETWEELTQKGWHLIDHQFGEAA